MNSPDYLKAKSLGLTDTNARWENGTDHHALKGGLAGEKYGGLKNECRAQEFRQDFKGRDRIA